MTAIDKSRRRLQVNRMLDAFINGPGSPEEKAVWLCEVVRKINCRMNRIEWAPSMASADTQRVLELERRLYFTACRDLTVAFGCVDEILACFAEVWLPKGRALELVHGVRIGIQQFFYGVRYEW